MVDLVLLSSFVGERCGDELLHRRRSFAPISPFQIFFIVTLGCTSPMLRLSFHRNLTLHSRLFGVVGGGMVPPPIRIEALFRYHTIGSDLEKVIGRSIKGKHSKERTKYTNILQKGPWFP